MTLLTVIVATLFTLSGCTGARRPGGFGAGVDDQGAAVNKLAPSVATTLAMVDAMLTLADVKNTDMVYDLGSGDGRIVIAAAKKFGARAVGFEIDPDFVKASRDNVRREGLHDLVEIRQQDILEADLSAASVVTLYLFPEANRKLRPRLWSQLKPGARVVSNYFDMDEWRPDKVIEMRDPMTGFYHKIYLWRITDAVKNMPLNRNDR
ncbi:MAG: methyltransferase domain-containing protein [Deltaproteobacteria bacterium]|nr:methyltransferase domain-containing protein [Deltaproteobacteria bacterium]